MYFERAFQRLGTAAQHFWMRDIASVPSGFAWYLRIDHGDYQEPWPRRLRPAAFYVIDTHLPKSLAKLRRQAQDYDWIFCAQRNAVPSFERASWLPLACDAAMHSGAARPSQFAIGFVGTDGGLPRKLYLQELRERYPDSYIGYAPHTQMSEIYRSSSLVFNYSIRNDINMRIFEALCAGRCLLTNAINENGFDELFRDREHLVVYHSPHELYHLLEYYLTHDEERERIAQQGQALVLAQHTYVHRAQTILQRVGQALTGPQTHVTEPLCASS